MSQHAVRGRLVFFLYKHEGHGASKRVEAEVLVFTHMHVVHKCAHTHTHTHPWGQDICRGVETNTSLAAGVWGGHVFLAVQSECYYSESFLPLRSDLNTPELISPLYCPPLLLSIILSRIRSKIWTLHSWFRECFFCDEMSNEQMSEWQTQ